MAINLFNSIQFTIDDNVIEKLDNTIYTIYINYLMKALPAIASKTSSNPDAYVYLAESIRAWPDQAALAARITQAGWSQVGWRNLSGGVVAVHKARKA